MVSRLNSNLLATVAILTYNGEEFLEELIDSILSQKTVFNFELIIIDSGSKDKTLSIIERYKRKSKNIRLIEITNNEFGHGRTRNFAMREAGGDYVCFLTQDATPLTNEWLQSYIDAFKLDDGISLGFGPHFPRKDCNPIIKRDLEQHFASFGAKEKPLIQEFTKENREEDLNTILGFFSDVNSCVKKSVWKKVPFKDVSYAEDQIIAHDMLKAGYKKVFVPKSAVFHSHTYPTHQYLRRYFDEYRGLKESINYTDPNVRPLNIVTHAVRGWLLDSRYIIKRKEYNVFEKVKWVYLAFWMNLFRFTASYLGPRYEKLPIFIFDRLSMERVNNLPFQSIFFV